MSAAGAPIPACAVVLERHGAPPVVAEVDVAAPAANEVRVRMVAAGICHTDLAAVRDARVTPVVLGHEGVGIVEEVGEGGNETLLGERVLLSWKTPCGACRRCLQGHAHLCLAPRTTAQPRVSRAGAPLAVLLDTGCFCEHVVVREEAVVAVPVALSDREAALVGCAVATGVGAALRTARVVYGDLVSIWGAGGVGLNVVAGARLAQAEVIIAIDPNPERRSAALARGATVACTPGEAAAVTQEATAGLGVDVAFEVVGQPAVMTEAIKGLGVGGTLVLVGAAARDDKLSFAPRRFMSRQQSIVGCIYGSLRGRYDLRALLDLCASGAIPLADLPGETIGLTDVPAAFVDPPPGIRTVIEFA